MDEGLGAYLENPSRPGPNYYKDCKNWNWVDVLVTNHRSHLEKKGIYNVYGVDMTEAEIREMERLNGLNNSNIISLSGALLSVSLAYISLI